MRIAQIAPVVESVPPHSYGGTERVVYALTEELVRLGHQVTLFASGDSRTSARLVPVVDSALWRHPRYRDPLPFAALALGMAFSRPEEFDVVHSHLDYLSFPMARLAPVPVVTTLHGRLDLPELQPLSAEFNDVPLVSISHSQRRPLPRARWIATVYNGILVDEFPLADKPGEYLAFVGRMSPEKGVALAIKVALKAGLPLRIAARPPLRHPMSSHDADEWAYYHEVVVPLLRHPGIEYLGELAQADKVRLMAGAMALLFPVQWPEPFGLVPVEAMACGTPVIASRIGAVPEVVAHGETGFVCDSLEEMVQACHTAPYLDRVACRRHVERHFSAARMAREYEAVYHTISRCQARSLPDRMQDGR